MFGLLVRAHTIACTHNSNGLRWVGLAYTFPVPWPAENGDCFLGLGRESGSKAATEVAVSTLRLSRGPGSKADIGVVLYVCVFPAAW